MIWPMPGRLQPVFALNGQVESKVGKDSQGHIAYTVSLLNVNNTNTALQAAWNAGATDAFIVRPQ